MKKYLIFLLLLAGYMSRLAAQTLTSAYNLNYIPPSPSAAALGKFGEVPVGLNSGIPTINVPLFSYKGNSNNLSLNVSLDYHAGGIRVEEVSGNVGLGWALNSGGIISRTVRGLPDDMPTYGFLANYPLTPPDNTLFQPNNALKNYLANGIDAEQDEFNFNFNGHSGKFIIGGHGNPILVTKEALKIQPIHNSATLALPYRGFIITDEQGIKYTFTDAEITQTEMSTQVPIVTYSSSWYISNIINPAANDTIKFSYNTAGHSNYQLSSESAKNLKVGYTQVASNIDYSESVGNNLTVVSKLIKKIALPNHTEIEFAYNPLSRCDLKGDSTLYQVKQKNTVTNQYKTFTLYQSYNGTTAYSPAPCDLGDGVNSTTLRLRLDSVKETGGSNAVKPYKFLYNDTYVLPAITSWQQDLWGFYNGTRNGSGHLVPQTFYDNGTNYNFLDGADRRVDSNAVSAGALTKIIYPTGGYSQFDYEANRAGDGKLVFLTYNTNNNIAFDAAMDHTQTFTVNNVRSGQSTDFNFNMSVWCLGADPGCTFRYKIKSLDDATTYAQVDFGYTEVPGVKTIPLSLPNGSYHLTWEFSTVSCSCTDPFAFQLNFKTIVPDSTQLGGGIRIKKLTNYDGISHANDVVKQYRYIQANGKSSGYAAALPTFTHDYSDCSSSTDGDASSITVYDYVARTATTNVPLTYSNGGVNYARVEVATLGSPANGKEVSYFTSYKDYPPGNLSGALFQFPFPPMQTEDWNLGLLTRHEVYDAGGTMLNKTENTYLPYSPDFQDTLINYKVGVVQMDNCGAQGAALAPGASPYGTTYNVVNYYWLVSHNDKIQSTTVDYTTAGDSLVTNHWYTYNPNYYTLSIDKTVNSKGDTVITRHYYPFDYTISGSVLGAMVDSNMIATPVSNEIWKNVAGSWYLTGADATNYQLFNTASYLPAQYYTLSAASPVPSATIGGFNPAALLRVPSLYEQALSFDVYDGKANPLQITRRTGPPTTYLWSYNKELPIAQIENAAYSTVQAALGGSTVVNNFSNRPMPVKSDVDSYLSPLFSNSSMVNAEIRSYVYDPLLGVTSSTDQKGMTTYYEYDPLFRLLNIKDTHGNILKSTTYHYQNQ